MNDNGSICGSDWYRRIMENRRAEARWIQSKLDEAFLNYLREYLTNGPRSVLEAAVNGEWPLRCEMKPKPSTRLADDLPE